MLEGFFNSLTIGKKGPHRWEKRFPREESFWKFHKAFKCLAGNFKKVVKERGKLELAEEMLEGGEGVVEEHTWTSPAHHRLNAGFHVGPVAVYGTFAAGGLRYTVATTV